MTRFMEDTMGDRDIAPIPEFVEMITDTGAGRYACQASVDLFGLEKIYTTPRQHHRWENFNQVSADGQIIFT